MQRVFQRVGWSCCCWFPPLLRGVYLKALRFSPSSSKAKFHSIWNSRVRLNVVLKKRFVGKLITTTFFFKQNYKSVDPNSQLRSQSYLLPVVTERERETGRRENLATRLPNSRLERRKVFASHSFLFKQIANMTGRFPKTLQMRIRKNAV